MPQVSDSESIVLQALWQRSPLTADEVIDAVAEPNGWSAATVKTLLNRLLKKGAVSAKTEGRKYHYTPLVTRDDYIQRESKTLIDRLFGGEVAPLVSHFSERQALTDDDIAALKKLVEGLEQDD